ncbi:MAG: DUF4173 domain-containing protein, partial [Bacteroidota bacterium]
YHAEMGINLLLFDGLLIVAALRCRPELAENRSFVWSVTGLLFAALAVIIVHGPTAIFAHHLTYLVVLGFAQARELRFIWYGLLLGAISLFKGVIQWSRHRQKSRAEADVAEVSSSQQLFRWVRQGFLPLLILAPFLLFYLLGNEVLGRAANNLLVNFNLPSLDIPVWVIFLFSVSTVLCLPLLFPRLQPSWLAAHQLGFRDELLRRNASSARHLRPRPDLLTNSPSPALVPHKMLALRNHYRQAVISFVLLNALLAVVNFTDLAFVWLPAHSLSAATLSHYVHVGTWNLTFSIALAMLVVLYYFRGNLNFLANTPLLRPLARLWLAQNALLALSVGIRNYHYIDAYGLAGGRIMVGFVLLLILFGLYTLWRKIDHRLSLTWLLQTNGIAAWLLLLAFSAVNWSGVITRYNLATQTTEEIDWQYLCSGLDRRNTFLLFDHPEDPLGMHGKTLSSTHKVADWRSWNYADWRNYRFILQND